MFRRLSNEISPNSFNLLCCYVAAEVKSVVVCLNDNSITQRLHLVLKNLFERKKTLQLPTLKMMQLQVVEYETMPAISKRPPLSGKP